MKQLKGCMEMTKATDEEQRRAARKKLEAKVRVLGAEMKTTETTVSAEAKILDVRKTSGHPMPAPKGVRKATAGSWQHGVSSRSGALALFCEHEHEKASGSKISWDNCPVRRAVLASAKVAQEGTASSVSPVQGAVGEDDAMKGGAAGKSTAKTGPCGLMNSLRLTCWLRILRMRLAGDLVSESTTTEQGGCHESCATCTDPPGQSDVCY